MEKRREFLKKLSALTATIMVPASNISFGKAPYSDKWGELLPKRKLGRAGIEVTMLGVGGYHFGNTTEKESQAIVEAAMEGGIRFFDTAESYGPHTSEIRYGKYLTPKYREEVFIMTKSTAKDAKTMREHLEGSLKRMKTDYIDLWQVHAVQDPADVDNRIANGVFEEIVKARDEGKVKHIGFTGHQNPEAHLRVLERIEDNPIFETVQMPINVVDANHDDFINTVLPKALDMNLGILAMKTMAAGRFFSIVKRGEKVDWQTDNPIIPNRLSVKDALYFVWSLPVSVLITGADTEALIKEKIKLAKEFTSITEKQRHALIDKVADLAKEGKVEYYKKT